MLTQNRCSRSVRIGVHDGPEYAENGRGGYWTLNGEIVKSQGERIIADWLFIYGVPYEYERPYEFATATSEYQQYKPDFYFPEINAYLEHWAVDQNGQVVKAFKGYEESMRWKRITHQSKGTILLETSYGDLLDGALSRKLRAQLLEQGQKLDYDPERVGSGREPISDRRLLSTMRTFLSHVKGNQLSMAALRKRMDQGLGGRSLERQVLFLDLFEPVWSAWEGRLKASKGIDFDDMLSAAADLMERKAWKNPYRLILVDEFQDTSQARGRLIKQLAKKHNSCLFTVGDDWQSINRFAGSDLSLMTDFSSHFGDETTLALGTTFRCPQALCDISSEFIQKNPSQIQKQVTSASALRPRKPVSIRRANSEAEIQSMVKARVQQLIKAAKAPMTVLILGRYNQDHRFVPRLPKVSGVKVEFRTVHGAKGLQADHVILPNLTAGTYGFPSRIEDDPVIQLAMPGGDRFPNAEERRLFYVALTRAKSSVSIMTVAGRESEFLVELVQDHGLQMRSDDGAVTVEQELTCPKCKKGVLVEKAGRYGKFMSCSRFPTCRYARSHDD